ncbi:unnamed protein product [Durusdinium trenchii]|uniref:Glutathione transferase n=1 Tax=Durusdinium trenchii TaxID=1381693 RepID=A0ABP0S6M4_9DINO
MVVGLGEVVKTSSLVTLLVYLKFFISNLRWGLLKGKANLRAREDVNNNENATQDDVDRANHAGRIVQNDMENLPMGLVVIWACVFTIFVSSTSVQDPQAFCIAHLVFTAMWATFRVIHTIIYELQLGLLRGITFMLSMCCLWGLMILMVVAAFSLP